MDQVAFVDYNPWENSYEKESNGLSTACSDLWRRMFVWWDGKINPCDVDYKSKLSVGNISDGTIKSLWNSNFYNDLREKHLNNKRQSVSLVTCSHLTMTKFKFVKRSKILSSTRFRYLRLDKNEVSPFPKKFISLFKRKLDSKFKYISRDF